MRNLKKALSLSLALVMLLGMMVVGAGAASFTDVAKDSEKIEAIQVMNGIEVLQGFGDGTFGPDQTLTRAQAATIIAKAVMGPKVVEALNKSDVECQFEDVNTTAQWAAPAIQACVAQGIIAGNGDGTFAPNAEVTGEQFAAMLLRALEFDKTLYANNDNWAFNVRRDAIKAGLNANGVVVSSAKMSRQDAAQMAFSAVLYSPSGSNGYKVDGGEPVTNVVFPSLLDAVLYQGNQDEKGTLQATTASDSLAKTIHNLSESTSTDAFGREMSTWVVEGKKDPVYTVPGFLGATTWTTEKKATDSDIKNLKYADKVEYFINGVEVDAADAKAVVDYTGNGVEVSVYKNAKNEVNKVVVVSTILAQISNVNENSKTIYLSVKGGTDIPSLKTVGEKHSCYDALAAMGKGAYVLVTAANRDVVTVTEPIVVTGKVTAINTKAGTLTVDGTTYTNAKNANESVGVDVDSEREQMVYTDAAGNAYFATGVKTANDTDVVYVTNVYTGVNSMGAANVPMFQGVLATGEVITGQWTTKDGSMDFNDGDAGTDAAGAINNGEPIAYRYQMNGSKYYLFAGVDGTGKGAVDLGKEYDLDTGKKTVGGSSDVKNNYFAPNVKVVYVTGEENTLTAVVKDGRQVVTLNDATHAYAVVSEDTDKNYVITTVFVTDTPTTLNDAVIFVHKDDGCRNGKTKLAEDGKTRLYGYTVYVNGESEDIWCKSSNVGFDEYKFYGYSIDEATGAYVIGSAKKPGGAFAETGLGPGDVKKFGGSYAVSGVAYPSSSFNDYDLTGAVVVDLTGNGKNNVEALRIWNKGDDKTPGTSLMVYMVANTEDKTIVTVYVTQVLTEGLEPGAEVDDITNDFVTSDEDKTTVKGDIGTEKKDEDDAPVVGTIQNETTVGGDIKHAELTVAGEKASLTVEGVIDEDTTITVESGKLTLNDNEGTILVAEGATVEVKGTNSGTIKTYKADALKNISAGPDAKWEDAVKLLKGTDARIMLLDDEAETEIKDQTYVLTDDTVKNLLKLYVPVYAQYGSKEAAGYNIQDNTVVVKWNAGTLKAGEKVLEIITDGTRTFTITNEQSDRKYNTVASDKTITTMFDLNAPFSGDDKGAQAGVWTGTGDYTGFAGVNKTLTITIKVVDSDGKDVRTIMSFTMPNPIGK